MARAGILRRAVRAFPGMGKASKEAAEEVAEQSARTSSAWADSLGRSSVKLGAIGGTVYGGSKGLDAYGERQDRLETNAVLEQQEEILNDPHLSEAEKAAALQNLERGDNKPKGVMAWMDNLSITQAIMLTVFGYFGVQMLTAVAGGAA